MKALDRRRLRAIRRAYERIDLLELRLMTSDLAAARQAAEMRRDFTTKTVQRIERSMSSRSEKRRLKRRIVSGH